jgi:(2Fe-2S) ferredoxin
MSSYEYRVLVCTKKRHPDDPEGCCHSCGGSEIYRAFQEEIKQRGLGDRVQVCQTGCLDRCDAGPVALIYQPKQRDLSWLPMKVRVKLREILFTNKHWYGNFKSANVSAIVESHLLKGKPLKKHQI